MEAEIAKALVEFRGKVETIAFDSANPHFKNRFASLAAILKSVDPVLHSCGLTIMQAPINRPEGRGMGVRTTVIHESGQTIESELFLPVMKDDPQAAGSTITYARRYALSAILSLSTDEDTDGEGAVGKRDAVANAGKPKAPRSKPKAPAMSQENRAVLKEAVDKRILVVGTPDDEQMMVLTIVAHKLGHASVIQIKDDELPKALEFANAWVPEKGDTDGSDQS